MRIEHFLESSARQFPDKVALVAGGSRVTYRELDEASSSLAAGLQAAGLSRGDRVVIVAENSWETVVSFFGALKAGGVVCMVGRSTKAEKLAFIIHDCRATVLIAHDAALPVVRQAVEYSSSLNAVVIAGERDLAGVAGAARLSDLLRTPASSKGHAGISLDLALLIYTSGSTGTPKGVMMTHQNVVAAIRSITTYLENSADDVILNVLPVAFNYGMGQILAAIKVGATLVLEKSFAFPQAVFETMRVENVTGFPLVPTMAAVIAQMRDLKPGMFPSLRYITNAAAALPTAHLHKILELFPSAQFFSMYGLTECNRGLFLPPQELTARPASVGVAIPGTEAYIVDESGAKLPPGRVGELVIRGPHVMKGYWENPEATAKALRPGPYPWENVLHTGDLFRMDEDGFLYFVSRMDDIIITRGEKVSPKEVENVLYTLPGVREAVVIGAPDEMLGNAIKAVVCLEEGAQLTASAVIRHCASRLEDFMVPKLVEIRGELPKTESGKINRREAASL
jgi:amino acid adenylation domain-containing protein